MSRLSELAKAELDELVSLGIEPTWEDVCRINGAAWKVEKPTMPTPAATGRPVTVNGLTLWPFTVQGGEWYAFAAESLENEAETFFALAYALSHGRDRGAFNDMWDVRQARRHLKQFRRNLPCTQEELVEGVSEIIGERSEAPADSSAESWQKVIAFLISQAGGTPEMWTREVSQEYISEQLRTIIDQQRAEGSPPSPDDPGIKATVELGRIIMDIKQCQPQK